MNMAARQIVVSAVVSVAANAVVVYVAVAAVGDDVDTDTVLPGLNIALGDRKEQLKVMCYVQRSSQVAKISQSLGWTTHKKNMYHSESDPLC